METKETKIKRFEHTAETYEKKGQREWAYAKNGQGGEHYQMARQAFERAEDFRNRANNLKK